MNMILITGLGNPGREYSNTKHNVGFKIVDSVGKKLDFPDFSQRGISKKGEVILLKPQTFMNKSGTAVKRAVKFYKTKEVWVIHDDNDINIGDIKICKNRGHAGHNGVKSVIDELKTKEFVRFRIGIKTNKKAKDTVLKPFSFTEKIKIKRGIKLGTEAILYALDNGIDKTMIKYN